MKLPEISRRSFLTYGLTGAGALLALGGRKAQACMDCILDRLREKGVISEAGLVAEAAEYGGKARSVAKGEFDPMAFLTHFDWGKATTLPDGRVQREYWFTAEDKEIEVAKGVIFPAWTVNGQVPGPTLRCNEGDLVKLYFTNPTSRPHTIHFHGIHPATMDGVIPEIKPGESFTYEFTADPFGLFLYHCHMMPLRKHVSRGFYGTFIVDPPTPRPPATEMVMVMNGFDVNFDMSNEFYAVNTFANYYGDNPIEIKVNEPVRIYLVNLLEFDLINSFHLHGNIFRLYRTGTSLTQYELTDTVLLCQGERSVLEFSYKYPGLYMFHAHQAEFAELGWLGFFKVVES